MNGVFMNSFGGYHSNDFSLFTLAACTVPISVIPTLELLIYNNPLIIAFTGIETLASTNPSKTQLKKNLAVHQLPRNQQYVQNKSL
jgi:hypothetical protein